MLITSKLDDDDLTMYTTKNTIYNHVNGPSKRNLRSFNFDHMPTYEEHVLSNSSLNNDMINRFMKQDNYIYPNAKKNNIDLHNYNNNNRVLLYVPDDEHGGYGYKPHIHYRSNVYINTLARNNKCNHLIPGEYLHSIIRHGY